MDTGFLSADPPDKSCYLRYAQSGNHLFQLYRNKIPVLRSFPPQIVLGTYLEIIEGMDINPSEKSPDDGVIRGRIVFGVLWRLYHALKPKKDALVGETGLKASNAKQQAGDLFRRGQAFVVHGICRDLLKPLQMLQMPAPSSDGFQPLALHRPGLVTVDHVTHCLDVEYPNQIRHIRDHVLNNDKHRWELVLTLVRKTTRCVWLRTATVVCSTMIVLLQNSL
jgi:hypothetical protein